ncbi:hypothetical protein [Blastomonas sp.]|uniref:hypothetical protein n=1 Tax=Blastomonas sp. TaxID=1909299 RepID=UPI003593E893
MIEFQLAGLALSKIVLAVFSIAAAIFIGVKLTNRTSRLWGWIGGLVTFGIVGVMIASATIGIDQRICRLDELADECD